MFKEIICAVTVLVALNYATHHIQRLIEKNVELEEQVLIADENTNGHGVRWTFVPVMDLNIA
jgi:hypothetical protein